MKQTYKFKIILSNHTVVEDSIEALSGHLAMQVMQARYPGAKCIIVGTMR